MKLLLKKIEGLPIGAVGATVGACTLSTVYQLLGFEFIRHAVLFVAMIVWLATLTKIIRHFTVFKSEYAHAVTGSLYGLFAMLSMVIGGYLHHYSAPLGKALWFIGIILHVIHIVCFTYVHLIKNFKFELFVPTWFVAYMGILVSIVVGGGMNEAPLLIGIYYYGVISTLIIVPIVFIKTLKHPYLPALLPTNTIFVVPPSLLLIGHFNLWAEPNLGYSFLLYAWMLIMLIYVLSKFPKILAQTFHPGFAALTFPLAISTLASFRMSAYLLDNGFKTFSLIVDQLFAVQLIIATSIIGFVCFQFIKKLTPSSKLELKKTLA